MTFRQGKAVLTVQCGAFLSIPGGAAANEHRLSGWGLESSLQSRGDLPQASACSPFNGDVDLEVPEDADSLHRGPVNHERCVKTPP